VRSVRGERERVSCVSCVCAAGGRNARIRDDVKQT